MSTLAIEARALNSKSSPLLALPGEIRNEIYRCVLVGEPIKLGLDRKLATLHSATHLLRTSSQTRNEAMAIFYFENSFLIAEEIGPNPRKHNAVQSFLHYAGRSNLQNIQSLQIRLHCSDFIWEILYVTLYRRAKGCRLECAWHAVVKELQLLVPCKPFYEYLSDVIVEMQQHARGLAEALLEAGVQSVSVTCAGRKERTETLSFVTQVVERIEVDFLQAAAKKAFEDAIVSSLPSE